MTEQELINGILEHNRQGSYFSDSLGIEYDHIGRDYCECHLTAEKRLCNPLHILHGGVYYTVMDQIAGTMAALTGKAGVTMDSSVNYLRAAKLGDTIRCKVESVHIGRSVGVYEARCYGEDGTLQCTGTFHLFFTRPIEECVH